MKTHFLRNRVVWLMTVASMICIALIGLLSTRQVSCGYSIEVLSSATPHSGVPMPTIVVSKANITPIIIAGAYTPEISKDCKYLAYGNQSIGSYGISIMRLDDQYISWSGYLTPNIEYHWSEDNRGVYYSDYNTPEDTFKWLAVPAS